MLQILDGEGWGYKSAKKWYEFFEWLLQQQQQQQQQQQHQQLIFNENVADKFLIGL